MFLQYIVVLEKMLYGSGTKYAISAGFRFHSAGSLYRGHESLCPHIKGIFSPCKADAYHITPGDLTGKDLFRQRILDQGLDRSLQRSRPVLRIKTLCDQRFPGRITELQFDLHVLPAPLRERTQLDRKDIGEVLLDRKSVV